MDALTMQNVGREMSAQRMQIPLQNRPKFDAESLEFFTAMSGAGAEQFHRLMRQWSERIWILKSSARCFAAPVCRVRRDGESAAEYLERIIEKDIRHHA